jgi:hypothetical protein
MFDRGDEFHRWTVDQLALLKPPFETCEAVISEACFLLLRQRFDTRYLFELFERKVLRSSFVLQDEFSAINILMNKYVRTPMALADACLVRMVEKNPDATVFTLDGDFLIYRKPNRQMISLLIPERIRKSVRRNLKRKH